MNINFFEEFPDDKNLKKLSLIDFPSLIFIASKSLNEFYRIKNKVSRINENIKVGYWPVLRKSYWISPFSYKSELEGLHNDLMRRKSKEKLEVLIDLELPLLNKKLFLLNLPFFFKNKNIIRELFNNQDKMNIRISTAEYTTLNKTTQKILQYLGVSYSTDKFPHKKIIMFYSSMIKNSMLRNKIEREIKDYYSKLGDNLQIGLGTIATGIMGNEPLLKPEQLDKDLKFCKSLGITSVFIFRLGGLNKEHIKVINRYVSYHYKG